MRVLLRSVLLIVFAVLYSDVWAAKLYWVGGTGNFNDTNHWSFESGGQGGAKSPTAADDVYFDENSFPFTSVINFIGSTEVHDLVFADNTHNVILAGTQNEKIVIGGEVKLNPYIDNQFFGDIHLVSSLQNTNVLFSFSTIKGNLYFDGTGGWNLQTLLASDNSEVHLNNGRVKLVNSSIRSGSIFVGDNATLEVTESVLSAKNKLWFNDPATLIDNGLYVEAPINDGSRYYTGSNHLPQNKIIDNNSPLSCAFTFTIVSQPKCANSCDGIVKFTIPASCAGTAGAPYKATWSGLCAVPAGTPVSSVPAGIYTQSNICGCGSAYTIVFRDQANALAGSVSVNITAPSSIQMFFSSTAPLCNAACNGKVFATIIGGTQPYSVKWNPGPTHAGNFGSDSITGLCVPPLSYVIVVTDANNCQATDSTTITAPTTLVANGSSTPPTCFGSCNGLASVAPSGGTPFASVQSNGIFYTTIWDGSAALNNDTLLNLCAGSTHTCVVTDQNGCTATYIVTIGASPPAISFTKNPASGLLNINCLNNCNGSVSVTGVTGGTPGYSYAWLPATGVPSGGGTSSTYSGLCGTVAGLTYTCTITDANTCTVTATFTVTAPPALTHTITGTNPKCVAGQGVSTGSITTTEGGGTGPYTFTWNSPPPTGTQASTTANPNTYTGLPPGTYTVNVTDNKGCLDSATVTLLPPVAVTGTITTSTNPTCPNLNNGQLCVTAGGGAPGYTYAWSPCAGVCTNTCSPATFTVPAGGSASYNVVITDINSCTLTVSGTLTSPIQATVTPAITNPACGSAPCTGSATLNVAGGGGGGFTYAWSCSPTTLNNISGRCGGTSCNYTVTDAVTNCKYTGTVTFAAAPPVLTATISATTLNCASDCNSTITSTVTGGTGIITYTWFPGPGSGPTLPAACAGNDTLHITDANGCTQSATVTITSPPALTVTLVPTQPTCNAICNGSILATITGGTGPYPCVNWSPSVNPPNPSTTLNPTGLCGALAPGTTYTLVICDSKGCKDSNTVTLITPPALTVSVNTGSVTCTGLCNGTATATVGGGIGPYTYSWDGGIFTNSIDTSGLCAGPHSLDIKDSGGCVGTTVPFTIIEPNPISASIINQINTCGPCTGSASTAPSGGTPPYSFTWLPPGGTVTSTSVTSTYSNLCIGNYTLIVGDTNNCPPSTVTFTINAIVAINIAASSQSVSCNNGSDGVGDATASGGTPNYNMVWTTSPGGVIVASCPSTPANCSAPGLPPGTYVITATDAAGCINKDSIVIGNPPVLTAGAAQTNQKCFGGVCTGSSTVTPSGGTPPYIVTWDDGTTGTPKSSMCPRAYSYTVTDNKGCQVVQTLTITSNPQFTVTNTTTPPLACGGVTGNITVTASGGTAGYGFAWSGGGIVTTISPTSTLTGVGAGVYTVTITDANLCDTVVQIALSDPGTATITATTQSVSCFGTCDGSTTVTAVGAAPITITWPNPAQSGGSPLTVNALCAGIYTVQTLDGNGCTQFFNDTILGPTQIIDNPTIVQPNCGSGGTINFAPTGGTGPYTYTWDGVAAVPPITNIAPGTHTVVITDSKPCSQTYTYTFNPASSLTVTVTQTNNTCTYGCTGSATVAVVGGTPAYTYTWTSSTGPLPVANTITNVSALCPGNYSVTVADNGGCSITQTFTIVPASAIVPNFTKKDNLCNAGCTGVASVAPTGGTGAPYTYNWTPGSGTVTSTATTSVDSFMCPNNYTVFVTDGAGCIDTTTFTIVQPTLLTVQVDSTNPTCFGVCNGSATVTPSGGTGSTYTVSWAPNANICAGVTNCVATNLCAPPTVPQYTITTTDSNSCVNTHILVLVAPPKINANVTPTDPKCNNDCNGSLTSNTTGGNAPFNYTWTPAGGIVSGVSPTSTYTNLCSGITYSLMITDASGCLDSSSYTLNNPLPLTMAATPSDATCGQVPCNGSVLITSVTGNGAITVNWLTTNCGNSLSCDTLCAGVYGVELTDSKGCKDTAFVGVSNPNGPTVFSTVTNDNCNDGISTGSICIDSVQGININQAYTFSWTPVGVTTQCITNQPAGTNYISTVTDSMLCQTNTQYTITVPSAIQDNGNSTSATCVGINNGTINSVASGGTPGTIGYTYTLDGLTTNTTGIFVGVSAGSHTVCISDSVGCQKCFPYTITPSTTITDTIIATPINCASNCNGVATLSNVNGGSGNYTMIWSDGQVGLIASGLCAGNYSVTITDTNGCQAIDSVTITAPAPITITTASVAPTCGSCNGTLSVTPSGGIPGVNPNYTYLWSPGGSTTFNIDSVCAGLHQLDIMDSVGCKQTIIIPVSDSLAPNVTVAATTPACNNVCNGVLTTTVTGGVAPYTYSWPVGGQTTPSISGQCPGVYFVQVKDSMGCIASVSDTVKQGSILSANPTIINPDCDSLNGSITTNVTGGSGSYSYSWSNGPITSGIGPVGAGSYTVIVTDIVSGCMDTIPIALNSANGPILTPFSTSPLCSGICLGTASVSIFGGAPTFTVSWNNGQSGVAIDSLCPSINPYIVTVTDANGCIQTASAFVNDVSPLISSLPVITQPKCNGDCNGSITTIFTGGTPIYTYAWSPATVIGPGGSGLCANNYSVLVTDANGCTAAEFDTLINPALLTITGTVTPSSCNTTPDAAINTTTNGGTPGSTAPGYTYTWSSGQSTSSLSNILSGNYTVVVNDSRNCKDSAAFVVTANISVTASAGNDTTICSIPNFVLNGDTTGATSMQWIQLPNPPLNVVGTTPTLTVSPIAGDTTQYVLIAQNGVCIASDTISVISNTLPVPDAGTASTVFLGQNATIGGSPTNPGTGTIVWHPTTNISDTTAANPTVTPSVTTTYTVYVTNSSGCMGWDTVTVTVLPTFVIPNGFSPNGDGYNETWQIDYIYMFPNCEVEVYNRWGEQLFYSKGYNTPWAGKYKGHDVPVGTYYYIIRLNDKKFPDHFTGPLTILR